MARDNNGSDSARAIGRPSTDEATVGREALIEATCEMLKYLPPRKMTRAQVARETGVHPSLIRYYFTNVHVLMIEAAKRFNQRYLDAVRSETNENDPIETRFRVRVGALVDMIWEYPYYQRLIVEEMLESDHPEARALMERMVSRGIGSYGAIIKEGVTAGIWRPVDDKLFFTSIIALADFQLTASHLYHLPERPTPKISDNFRSKYKDHICELLLDALRI